MVELLVVIGIIAVLIGILIPVIANVRQSAYAANTKNFVSQLSGAIERYQGDFRAYPGPIANNDLYNAAFSPAAPTFPFRAPAGVATATGFDTTFTINDQHQITGTENLVLGLLGGLTTVTIGGNATLVYDPSFVGRGPVSLNPNQPKTYAPYLEGQPQTLSWRTVGNDKTGRYGEDGLPGGIADSQIPEFVDNFPEKMPILYLRAKVGVPFVPPSIALDPDFGPTKNSVITNGQSGPTGFRVGAYDISQIRAYTASYDAAGGPDTNLTGPPGANFPLSVGVGKKPPVYFENNVQKFVGSDIPFPYHGLRTVNTYASLNPNEAGKFYYYPLDAFPYFQNPASIGSARQKDGYILIAAGADRMYGTKDDIVSFGSVGE